MSTCHRRCPDDECHAAGEPGCAFGSADENLSPVARACIANARRALAAANASLAPDRRPFTPPTPETPAERVQGEAGEAALEPCDSCGAGRNEPCCDGCSEDVDCRSYR